MRLNLVEGDTRLTLARQKFLWFWSFWFVFVVYLPVSCANIPASWLLKFKQWILSHPCFRAASKEKCCSCWCSALLFTYASGFLYKPVLFLKLNWRDEMGRGMEPLKRVCVTRGVLGCRWFRVYPRKSLQIEMGLKKHNQINKTQPVELSELSTTCCMSCKVVCVF